MPDSCGEVNPVKQVLGLWISRLVSCINNVCLLGMKGKSDIFPYLWHWYRIIFSQWHDCEICFSSKKVISLLLLQRSNNIFKITAASPPKKVFILLTTTKNKKNTHSSIGAQLLADVFYFAKAKRTCPTWCVLQPRLRSFF